MPPSPVPPRSPGPDIVRPLAVVLLVSLLAIAWLVFLRPGQLPEEAVTVPAESR